MKRLDCATGSPPPRTAFTLLELLVVIAIMGVLAALTFGTVMQVLNVQQKGNTERLIRNSVSPNLDSAKKAVIDQANELPIPQNVLNNMAGGDPARAKVIWRLLQLKRNFPVTYAEALQPWNIVGNHLVANSPLSATDLPPLEVFQKALQGVTLPPLDTFPPPPPFLPTEFQAEMGALLRLTLTVPRRGIRPFIAESDLGPQAVADTNGDGVPEIVDSWGNPLAFFRFPTDNADMNSSKPGTPSLDPRRDPQDPEGLLLSANWNNQANYNTQAGNYWFEQLVHRIHDPTAANWTPQAVFMLPTVVSDGPNGRLGIILGPSVAPFNVSGNFAMYVDPTDVPGYNDDIISFNLR